MSRESQGYLQQLCGYLDDNGVEWRGKVGRTSPVNEGIIGAGYGDSHIWRTKSFSSKHMIVDALCKEMKGKGRSRIVGNFVSGDSFSWTATPVFTSTQEQVDGIDPPRIKNVTSFNYEDAVA